MSFSVWLTLSSDEGIAILICFDWRCIARVDVMWGKTKLVVKQKSDEN